jgi:hypothetical protein
VAEFDIEGKGRRVPQPEPVEVVLWGGPRDGEVRKVHVLDVRLVLPFQQRAEVAPEEVVYRLRPADPDVDPAARPVFEFQPLEPVA